MTGAVGEEVAALADAFGDVSESDFDNLAGDACVRTPAREACPESVRARRDVEVYEQFA
ncbi:MAG: hypothetical protein OXF41_09120 [bacterium]|nr:hypothetical protein [bacterium]